jgi:hypothetical protein
MRGKERGACMGCSRKIATARKKRVMPLLATADGSTVLVRAADALKYSRSATSGPKPHPSPMRGCAKIGVDRGAGMGHARLSNSKHKWCAIKVRTRRRPMISDGPVNQHKPSHDCSWGHRTERQCWPPKGQSGLQPRGVVVVSGAHDVCSSWASVRPHQFAKTHDGFRSPSAAGCRRNIHPWYKMVCYLPQP